MSGFKTERPLDQDGRNTADYGWTALHWATYRADKEEIKEELKQVSNVNAADINGWTPLHGAVVNGHKWICELLVQAGADVNVKDIKGKTPLGLSTRTGHREVKEFLGQHGGLMDESGLEGKALDRWIIQNVSCKTMKS